MAKSKSRKTGRMVSRIEPIKSGLDISKLGQWVFLTGVLISIVAGLLSGMYSMVFWVLGVLGLIVGLINMLIKDEVPFLIAVLVILAASSNVNLFLKDIPYIGVRLVSVVTHLVIFVVPAGFVVALKAIYSFAKA